MSAKWKIGKEHAVSIEVRREEPNLDRAMDQARDTAVYRAGIDEDGHSDKVEGYDRSTCSIHVAFKEVETSISMLGDEIIYIFSAWIEQVRDDYDDEDDDDR